MTTITIIYCDSYTAVYVDDLLHTHNDYYSVGFALGFEFGQKYPEAAVVYKSVDYDWYDSVNAIMPQSLSEVKFD
jgi:hypothetical protein